jgi:hypothetical protein
MFILLFFNNLIFLKNIKNNNNNNNLSWFIISGWTISRVGEQNIPISSPPFLEVNVVVYNNNNFGQTRHMDKIDIIIMVIILWTQIFTRSENIIKKK